MAPHSLDVTDLRVRYGRAAALNGVNIRADGGSVTAVVGPNGAGKSTLLLAVYGAVRSTGSVVVNGADVGTHSSRARAREGVGIVPQGRQLFPRLSVRENLQVVAEMLRLPSTVIDEALDRFPILRARAKSLAGVLSGGEQQMLVVSRALMTSPGVILLDEMTTGLAPRIVQTLIDVVRELSAAGTAILMAEPSIHAVRDVIDRGYVLIRGTVVAVEERGGVELDHRYREAMGLGNHAALS
jgi:branched-chain amino acid transport system ATP-binding protein